MTGIFKIDFTTTNECYIGWTRNFESVMEQLIKHANTKEATNRLHDLIKEHGEAHFKATLLVPLPEGASKELLQKEKAKAIALHKPSLNSPQDRAMKTTTPIEDVNAKLDRILLLLEDNGLLGGNGVSSSGFEEQVVKALEWIKEQNDVMIEYIKYIYNKKV